MPLRAWLRVGGCALVLALYGAGVRAQDISAQPPQAPAQVLLIDQDRLFSGSVFGQAVGGVIDRVGRDLSAQNREIEDVLTQEEQRLTELRSSLSIEDFRLRAAEFDARVVEIRSEQDAKNRALGAYAEAARQRFLEIMGPILIDLVQRSGAEVLMDRRAVIFARDDIDITDEAIAAIDAALADRIDEILAELPEPQL
ncbi:OmpH family outer membrane protein [Rhodobacterales bacterium LSUCC1028]|jgi:Skp family chaperone for outer membrane proteins|nr:OmpH family outer membrane protein [Rhodobacterales bacterium FZCC0069]MBF9028050.1 OmpH family outer membrane protein [Rhodobacterales bacterium FZCC0188]MBF9053141.1 OmpH family outer membrane protein [Rhodobacterales bacterium LSUCC1028]